MSTPNDGGPAFPAISETNYTPPLGMSLRDYFAGQALAGILACPHTKSDLPPAETYAALAKVFYEFADAMLAAREGKP